MYQKKKNTSIDDARISIKLYENYTAPRTAGGKITVDEDDKLLFTYIPL